MKRWALVVAALALLGCTKQKRHGGAGEIAVDPARPRIELVYQYDFAKHDGPFVPVEEVMTVLRQRLTRAGLDDATVATDAATIVVTLPGLAPAELARVKHLLTAAGRVELALAADGDPYLRQLTDRAKQDAAQHHVTVGRSSYSREQTVVEDLFLLAPDRAGLQGYLDALTTSLPVPAGRRLVFEQQLAAGDRRAQWRSYLVGPAELDNADLDSADVRYDPQMPGRAQVELSLTKRGASRFEALTAANIGRRLLILRDGEVAAAPIIETAIAGGQVIITMGGSDDRAIERDATDLVNVLRSVPLTMPLVEATR